MVTYETLKSFCAYDTLRPQMMYACRREDGWWATDGTRIICVPMEECQQGDVRFLCDEMPNDVPKYPNVEALVDVKGFTPKLTISVQSINDALAQLPQTDEMKEVESEITFKQCPKCGGDGEIRIRESVYFNGRWLDAEATCECPVCHGYGKIPDIEDYNPEEDDYDPDDEEYSTMVPTGRKVPDVSGTLLHISGTGYFKAKFALDLLRVAKEQGVDEIECRGSNYRDCILFRIHGVIVGFIPCSNCDGKLDSVDIEL